MEAIYYILLAFGIGLLCSFLPIYISIKMHAIRKTNPLGRWNSWVTASSMRLLSLLGGYMFISYLCNRLKIDPHTNEIMLWVFTGIILLSILAHVRFMRFKIAEEAKPKNV